MGAAVSLQEDAVQEFEGGWSSWHVIFSVSLTFPLKMHSSGTYLKALLGVVCSHAPLCSSESLCGVLDPCGGGQEQ